MRGLKRWLGVAAASGALAVVPAVTGVAATTTVSASAGPVTVPGVPLSVCVNGHCVSTPAAQTVSLSITATATNNPVVVPPLVVPVACPPGQRGVGFAVSSISGGTVSVSGAVIVSVNGTPTAIPVGPISGPAVPGQTTTITACTTL